MRDLRILAFDDFIVGSTATWYTSADHNGPLGMADALELHAVATNVTGTTPSVTCQIEHSANGRHWLAAGTAAQITGTISNDASLYGNLPLLSPVLLTFVRIRITLGGTSPQCRLKLHVTGRVSRSASGGGAGMGALGGVPGQISASGQAAGEATSFPGNGGG